MPIVFAAITPHPPVLIPEIGKEHTEKLTQTLAAFKQLEQEFYASKPESILVISPHGKIMDDSFNINLSSDYTADFNDFGDFSVQLKFKSDFMSIQDIRSADEAGQNMPLVMTSETKLDHGTSIPLYFLTQHLKNIPVIPLTYSFLNYQQHFDFGRFLYRQLSKINKRFAVIASGDLSHRLTENAPAGYSPKGKEFDAKIVDLIRANKIAEVANFDPKLAKEAGECGLRSIITLLGLIESLNFTPEVLSYEGPFGVGYLVCNFRMV